MSDWLTVEEAEGAAVQEYRRQQYRSRKNGSDDDEEV
jgi:hypothetical protein